MSEHIRVPENVALVYRLVGDTHVFSSKGIQGLVHVGSHDRETAFHNVMEILGQHVGEAYGCEARYQCDMSYAQFCAHVDGDGDIAGNFLHVTLAKAA